MTHATTIEAAPFALPGDLLDAPLDGHRVAGRTLRELAADRPILVVFLRHYG